MKLLMVWTEWHNPYNWVTGETEDSEVAEAEGIENLKKIYPNTIGDITCQDPTDEWVEVSFQHTFELDNIIKLRLKVNELLENLVCPEVFSIVNADTKEVLFTEEDLN